MRAARACHGALFEIAEVLQEPAGFFLYIG
jgi:hypothetical protein